MDEERYKKLEEDFEELKTLVKSLQKEVKELRQQLSLKEEEPKIEKQDTKDMCICIYDNNQVGLFQRKNWATVTKYTKSRTIL